MAVPPRSFHGDWLETPSRRKRDLRNPHWIFLSCVPTLPPLVLWWPCQEHYSNHVRDCNIAESFHGKDSLINWVLNVHNKVNEILSMFKTLLALGKTNPKLQAAVITSKKFTNISRFFMQKCENARWCKKRYIMHVGELNE